MEGWDQWPSGQVFILSTRSRNLFDLFWDPQEIHQRLPYWGWAVRGVEPRAPYNLSISEPYMPQPFLGLNSLWPRQALNTHFPASSLAEIIGLPHQAHLPPLP